MLELLGDRYGNRLTLMTSQMPLDKWHALIGDSSPGDAIHDRLVHNAYRNQLKGESMRRHATKLMAVEASDQQCKPALLRSHCLAGCREWLAGFLAVVCTDVQLFIQ